MFRIAKKIKIQLSSKANMTTAEEAAQANWAALNDKFFEESKKNSSNRKFHKSIIKLYGSLILKRMFLDETSEKKNDEEAENARLSIRFKLLLQCQEIEKALIFYEQQQKLPKISSNDDNANNDSVTSNRDHGDRKSISKR